MRILVLLVLGWLCPFLGAGVVLTTDMPSGSWEIVPANRVEPYEGPACYGPGWKAARRESAAGLVSWFLPKASKLHGRPIAVWVLCGDDNGWTADELTARQWLSGQGKGQRPYVVVCAPDVTQLIDPNADSYAIWLVVEYADGARLPFFGAEFPKTQAIGGSPAAAIESWAVQMPQQYALNGQLAREGNRAKSHRTGHAEMVKRAQAPAFAGRAWAWDKWRGMEKGEHAALISWPPAPAQPEDGKPVRYFVLFGELDAPVFNDDAARVAEWLSGKGNGQWEFFIECAADVNQVLDLNKEKYRVYLAVEFESGRRAGYQGVDCPRVENYTEGMSSRVSRSAFRLPLNYGRPRPAELVDIRDRVGAYLKAGRSWKTRQVTTVINAGRSETWTHVEILKVGESDVEYRVTELGADQKPVPGGEPQILRLPLKVPKGGAQPATVLETITVGAGTFECARSFSEANGVKTTTWHSTKFSGLVVKQVTLSDTLETVSELVEFKE